MSKKSRKNLEDFIRLNIESTSGLNDEYTPHKELDSKARHRRNIKRRMDELKEQKWIKQHNWFDDESFYDTSGVNV